LPQGKCFFKYTPSKKEKDKQLTRLYIFFFNKRIEPQKGKFLGGCFTRSARSGAKLTGKEQAIVLILHKAVKYFKKLNFFSR